MPENNLLHGAAKSATYNILLQFLLRIVTFAGNGIIIRHIAPDLLGVINVRLALLFTTVQFISREGFRRACLNSNDKTNYSQVINLVWCSVPVTVVTAAVFSLVWLQVLDRPASYPHFAPAVVVYAASAVVEALAEPLWFVSQAFFFVHLRVIVDGCSHLIRCLATVILVILYSNHGLVVFCSTQLLGSIIYTASYYIFFALYLRSKTRAKESTLLPFRSILDLLPSRILDTTFVDYSTSLLVFSFLKQSVLKQVLTEGERYMMTIFDLLSFSEQGIFDVVSNLGSLVARFIFAPIEQEGYLFFTRSIERGSSIHKQSKSQLILCTKVFGYLLKSAILFGCGFMVFGLPYSALVLYIYGGPALSTGIGPSLLQVYCVYVIILAVNGITECFSFAIMSKQQIDRYNFVMIIISLVTLGSSWMFARVFGAPGLILANCINMISRISHSLYVIYKFYSNEYLSPATYVKMSRSVALSFIASFSIINIIQKVCPPFYRTTGLVLHLLLGFALFLAQCAFIYLQEHELITFIRHQLSQLKEKSI